MGRHRSLRSARQPVKHRLTSLFLVENILGKSRLHALCQMDFDARCQIPVIHELQTEFFADIAQFYIIIFVYYANTKCKNNLQLRLQRHLRCFILVVENKTTAVAGSWRSLQPAQVVSAPTQRTNPHRREIIPYSPRICKYSPCGGVSALSSYSDAPCRKSPARCFV